MKTRVAPAALILAALAALLLWRCHGHGAKPTHATTTAAAKSGGGSATMATTTRPDPKTQPRASIAGTVMDEQKAPIGKARVCAVLYSQQISAQDVRDPICVTADDKGQYVIKDLFAAEYSVGAAAKPFRPGTYKPGGEKDPRTFELAGGEAKIGVDIVLRAGGVEITGIVSDVSGGPVAHALVSASRDWWDSEAEPPVESDDSGAFSMWVAPGDVHVSATADGYAPGSDDGRAPGTFQILLTPESSLAGVVVDAKSGEPVAGVVVEASGSEWGGFGFFSGSKGADTDVTDDKGAFRISRIEPGRYTVSASSAHGYGVSAGSTLVGLGQHVDGVVVKLHPGYRVSGIVQLPDKSPCKQASLWLEEQKLGHSFSGIREPDGSLHADGVLPGTYTVNASCEGFQSKDKYDKLVVVDKDLENLVWQVDAGGTIKGRVLTKAGAPIEDANVWARSTGGAARDKTGWGGDTSARDGTYAMKGLKAGSYKIEVTSELGNAPVEGFKVELGANATLEKDLILDDGGAISGTVVDDKGKPVVGVHVSASPISNGGFNWGGNNVRTKQDGSFVAENLRAGDYRVTAMRSDWFDDLRKPGSTDDSKQGEKVTVAVGKTASVKLVVESQSGVIKGTIVDAAGAVVSDAFISSARESDAAGAQASAVEQTRWSFDDKPVLSNVDGTFALTKLSPGKYTIRAYRKGGGEAVAEHVAVGGTAKLVIKATGALSGTVHKDGTPADKLEQISLDISDRKTGFSRHESFFRTGGVWSMKDLPAGNFTLTATSETGKKQITVELAEGQQKDGIDIALDELVTIKGKVVDMQTKAPVAGMRMFASLAKSGGGFSFGADDDNENITDDSGAFTIKDAPRGKLQIRGWPKDFRDGDYGWLNVERDSTGSGTIDLGELPVLKKRLKQNQPAGELGIHFAETAPDEDADKHQYKVSFIDPQGPAAKTDIKVGDVITSIDGIDVSGANYANGWTLMRAPAGTKLTLGLARGATVTVTLVAQ